MSDKESILVVDDDVRLAGQMARALERRGYVTEVAHDGGEALELMREDPTEWVLLDLKMPGADGLSVLKEMMALTPQPRVVMLTGFASLGTAVEAAHMGVVQVLQKPADADEVVAAFTEGRGQTEVHAPTLARAEWEHIQRVLDECEGNISQAARVLGLHRRTLQRKLSKNAPKR
ncbi:MAG: response regulator [Myxococcota bacterium]|nr:response regulator [Myxococcota bacterium]